MKLFVFGTGGFGSSKRPTNLPNDIQEQLLLEIAAGTEILVGDCYGIDYLVQKFLDKNNYAKVTVYATGNATRNNVGYWEEKFIQVPHNITGREMHTYKDIAMQNDCDRGLAIWDYKSKGTENNIVNLRQMGKPVKVYNLIFNSWSQTAS